MLVYCDPKTWPENPEKLNLPEGWFVAVGVHPKHALDFGDFYFDRLSRLLDSPAVAALGEVGIDSSEGAKPFGIQSSTLKWVFGAGSAVYASGVSHPGLGGQPSGNGCVIPGGIGPDAGQSPQYPAKYPPPLFQWG